MCALILFKDEKILPHTVHGVGLGWWISSICLLILVEINLKQMGHSPPPDLIPERKWGYRVLYSLIFLHKLVNPDSVEAPGQCIICETFKCLYISDGLRHL